MPTAMGMALENAMAFGVNEALKRAFPDDDSKTGGQNNTPNMVKPFAMVRLFCSDFPQHPSKELNGSAGVSCVFVFRVPLPAVFQRWCCCRAKSSR